MSNPLIQVATFQFGPEAELARLRLEQEGIAAVLVDAETVNMNWMLGNAVGFIKLHVPQSDAERARELLETARERTAEPEFVPRVRCRNCGEILAETVTTCPMCGNRISTASANDDDDPTDEPAGIMSRFRSGKKLVVLLMLSPCLAGAVITALLLVVAEFQNMPQLLGAILLLIGCGALCLLAYRVLVNWLLR